MQTYGQSEWTAEAYRLREAARHARENQREAASNEVSKTINSLPILTSEWTLEAFQSREEIRQREDTIVAKTDDESEIIDITNSNLNVEAKQSRPSTSNEMWDKNSPSHVLSGSNPFTDQAQSLPEVINDFVQEEHVISPQIPLQELAQPASLNSYNVEVEAINNHYALPNRRKVSANDKREHSETSYVNDSIDNTNIYNLDDIRDKIRPLTSSSKINANGSVSNAQSRIKKIIIVLVSALVGFIVGYARNNY